MIPARVEASRALPPGGPVSWAEVEHTDVAELRGPLVVVRGTAGVGWDELASVRLGSGETRPGLVLEVDRDLVVVQVLEGTDGMDPRRTRVAFSGSPMRIPIGPGWLGRVCNGRGQPLDGGPPVFGPTTAPVAGAPLNPTLRQPPAEPVLTGVSAIDALTTLVRGQKLPIFSSAGLPHLDLATQVAAQASAGAEPFSVVFAAMGLTHADAAAVRDALETRSAAGELALLLNLADDPVIERILTPRIALTVAEHLAFALGRHVLVVMADMTSYCEAVREVSIARGEIPARRAYPGYLYSDLASLYERCGRVRGLDGSVTVLPVLTMPAGDITHPVPDLTGYITEGQVVLSPEAHARGIYPPVDPLSSLSRLMRKGAGPGRTRPEHLDLAAQLLAALARARQARELAELVGASALSATDRGYLALEQAFERELVSQRPDERRSLDETFQRAWRVLSVLPRRELTMLPTAALDAHYQARDDGAEQQEGR
ncbi:MAG TPA: V-type ATP synthase subunit B [Actinomycetota bacterium]